VRGDQPWYWNLTYTNLTVTETIQLTADAQAKRRENTGTEVMDKYSQMREFYSQKIDSQVPPCKERVK
jgi:ABC-type transporter lipoprotein component MlaA